MPALLEVWAILKPFLTNWKVWAALALAVFGLWGLHEKHRADAAQVTISRLQDNNKTLAANVDRLQKAIAQQNAQITAQGAASAAALAKAQGQVKKAALAHPAAVAAASAIATAPATQFDEEFLKYLRSR